MPTKTQQGGRRTGGAASKRARGLVQIVVGLSRAEREYLKAAAPLAGAPSMQDFVREAALFSARKVLPDKHLREIEKKIEGELDKSD